MFYIITLLSVDGLHWSVEKCMVRNRKRIVLVTDKNGNRYCVGQLKVGTHRWPAFMHLEFKQIIAIINGNYISV